MKISRISIEKSFTISAGYQGVRTGVQLVADLQPGDDIDDVTDKLSTDVQERLEATMPQATKDILRLVSTAKRIERSLPGK